MVICKHNRQPHECCMFGYSQLMPSMDPKSISVLYAMRGLRFPIVMDVLWEGGGGTGTATRPHWH